MKRVLVVFALLGLVATVVALLDSERAEAPRTLGTDTYGEGALGHRAFADVLKELDVHVLVDRRGVHPTADAPVFFIEPLPSAETDGMDAILIDAIADRRRAGLDSVVVLPKWHPASPEQHNPVIRIDENEAQHVLSSALPESDLVLRREDVDVPETARIREWTVPSSSGKRRVALAERQTLRVHDDRVEVLLGTRRAALIVRTRLDSASGWVYVIADPDLLHNFNLHRGDHAQIFLDLLEALGTDAVVIDETFHGHAFELTIPGALGSVPAVLVVVHAFGLLLLFLWASARPFGPEPRPTALPPGNRALLRASARALAATNRGAAHVIGPYVTLVLSEAADQLGVAPNQPIGMRARALDELARRRGLQGGALELLTEVQTLPRSKHRLLGIARRAHRLRQRLSTPRERT